MALTLLGPATYNLAKHLFGKVKLKVENHWHCLRWLKSTKSLLPGHLTSTLMSLKPVKKSVSDNEVKKLLLKHGCSNIEFLECPEVLQLSVTNVTHRVRRLKSLKIAATPVMVKLAGEHDGRTLRKLIRQYQRKHDGYSSRARQLQHKLNLTEKDLHMLADSDAKLLHTSNRAKSVERLEWLCWKGYSIKDIVECPKVLEKPVDVLGRRHKILNDTGVSHPPLKYLAMTGNQYEVLTKKLEVNPNMADTLATTNITLHGRSIIVSNFQLVKPKVELLINNGYSSEVIKQHGNLLKSVNTEVLQGVVAAAKMFPGIAVNLETLLLLCFDSMKRRKIAISKLLNCAVSDLPSAKRSSPFVLMYFREAGVYFENLQFLLSKDFTVEQISYCPMLIAHRPQIVQHHWLILHSEETSYVNEIKPDRIKYLHLLQYHIEKKHNFLHCIII